MVFEQIENLKRQFTDKYVVVDESLPELRRFRGYTGLVKTVNMSGRALVEFEEFENNIGWFDIDLDFLKVVDRAPPKQEKPARAAPAKPTPSDTKAAAKVEAAPQGAKAPAAGMSVQDILAAARGKAGGAPAAAPQETTPKAASAPAKPATPAGQMSVADILAAARGEKAAGAKTTSPAAEAQKPEEKAAIKMETPLAKDPSQMSVAEILAAARAGKAAPPPAAPAQTAVAMEPEPVASPAPSAKPAAAPAPRPEAAPAGELPANTADIIAWCRQRDSKS
jgi:hypothetical protein